MRTIRWASLTGLLLAGCAVAQPAWYETTEPVGSEWNVVSRNRTPKNGSAPAAKRSARTAPKEEGAAPETGARPRENAGSTCANCGQAVDRSRDIECSHCGASLR